MKVLFKRLTVFLLLLSVSFALFSAIPVVDSAAIEQLITHCREMLLKYYERDVIISDFLEKKFEFFANLRYVIYKSESLFNAITFYPKDLPGLYEFGAYFFDRKKKEIWHDLFFYFDSLFNKFKYLEDISFITENRYVRENPVWQEFSRFVISLDKENNSELENILDMLADMRRLQVERRNALDQYLPVITRAWGSTGSDKYKNVNVNKLYYATVCSEIESIKQLQQTEIMLRVFLELHLKKEVNSTRFKKVYASFNKDNSLYWKFFKKR